MRRAWADAICERDLHEEDGLDEEDLGPGDDDGLGNEDDDIDDADEDDEDGTDDDFLGAGLD